MDSSQLCQKHAEEKSEQPFVTDASIVHDLEEPEITWQLLLRDATAATALTRRGRLRPGGEALRGHQKPIRAQSRPTPLGDFLAIPTGGRLRPGVASGLSQGLSASLSLLSVDSTYRHSSHY
jgi:hypothetical protein